MGAREDYQTIHIESELKKAEQKIIELEEKLREKMITIPVEMLEEIIQGAFERGVKYASVDEKMRNEVGKKFVGILLKTLEQKGQVINNG
jgi:hypothetical protein